MSEKPPRLKHETNLKELLTNYYMDIQVASVKACITSKGSLRKEEGEITGKEGL